MIHQATSRDKLIALTIFFRAFPEKDLTPLVDFLVTRWWRWAAIKAGNVINAARAKPEILPVLDVDDARKQKKDGFLAQRVLSDPRETR